MDRSIYPTFNAVIELALIVIHEAQCFGLEMLVRELVVRPLPCAALN